MRRPTRCVLAALLLATWGLGCHDDSRATDGGSPDGGSEDGGYEWDGTYVPLEERGNFIDTGPFAPCTAVTVNDAGTPVTCGSPEAFDLSSCNRSTLSQLSPDGIYSLIERAHGSNFFGHFSGSFQISSSGGREAVDTAPLVQKQVDSQSLYVSGLRTLRDGGTQLYAFAACEAQSPLHFNGCYQTCINGGPRQTSGTFEGVRTQRLDEPERSNIEFVSERRVNLGTPVDVYVTKGRAYVVSLNYVTTTEGGLTVFNVTDKANPVQTKVVTLPGDIYWNSVWAKGDALYVGSGNHGVLVYDITNPDDPQLVKGVPGDTFDVHTLYVDGNRLYAQAAGAYQELIFDVSNPLDPVLLSRYMVPIDSNGAGYPHDAFAYQNRLYINQMGQGYYVLDVTDGSNPQPLGSYTYDADYYNASHANAVGTFAGKTIAFEGGEDINAHLRVLDVSDPAHIVKIGEFSMRPQSSIHNMVLVGKRLYIAWYTEGLRVLDVSNPTQPKQIAYANTFRDSDPGRIDGFFAGAIGIRVPGDGYVYVVDMTRGLMIYREP